jgi:hypothetical protein
MFRVMNSDTLDLGGERRGPARRGRCRGHRCGRGVLPTAPMQGEGEGEGDALRTASRPRLPTYVLFLSSCVPCLRAAPQLHIHLPTCVLLHIHLKFIVSFWWF